MSLSQVSRDALVSVYGTIPPLPIPLSDRPQVKRAIAGLVFGVPFHTEEDFDNYFSDDGNFAKRNTVNRFLSEIAGVGPEGVFVSVFSHPDTVLVPDMTLLEFDRTYFDDLEKALSSGTSRPKRDYSESLYNVWTCRRGDEKLVYDFIYAAGPYIWHDLEDNLFDWVEKRYPSPENVTLGTTEFVAEMRRRLEEPTALERLTHALYAAGSAIMVRMNEDENVLRLFDDEPAWKVSRREIDVTEIRETVILSNRKAMDAVRLGYLGEDFSKLPDGDVALESKLAGVRADFLAKLEQEAIELETKFGFSKEEGVSLLP